jgi:cytochrome c peroxidase
VGRVATLLGTLSIALVVALPVARALDRTPESARAAVDDLKREYRRPTVVPFPADNAWTPDRERLGRTLFFDPRLSASGVTSCATCHNPALSWGDGLAKGVGHEHRAVGRRTPTILNAAWGELMFWDGRADSLEAQALGPIEATGEMNMPIARMLSTVSAIEGYQRMFEHAYPGEGITRQTVAKAIATFERTVVSGVAPFDEWVAGRETAISESARRGFVLFNGKARCAVCHRGWNLSDQGFYDLGLPSADRGRGALVPKRLLQHAFKTPTLRNIAERAPYMHDGSLATLAEVIDFYDRGGIDRPSRSPEMRALALSPAEKDDLLAFLHTLTSVEAPVVVPVLPR